ncbi:YihA family ribosome biogenesis GTP-binding protein [Crassaminicella thermophila]|uniref:Probable GTP-binding protein EngB n=1 Tax=Crassaminicella thermophila TaxID=2599308 RepID=A0A5C0SEM9_CRATE|nr:ribosome biogenesis GTP-binding protein YihA/YsxC [Crassaminicella thermophila]QEK12893.1 YihA family ribosome biogenesis GTP-binding protein [Crassaminicella thermophila]
MKIKSAEIVISAVKMEQYPKDDLPEIALAGRSNVGKSSLINLLVNRRKLARTSSSPGKTQTINFYDINGQFRFVDLPGYGYAKVSKASKEQWGKMMDLYLNNRKNLIEVIQLVDIRHAPTQQDKHMYSWIKHFGFNGIVIATKLDKIKRGQRQKQLNLIRKELNMNSEDIIIPVSSESREGKEELWELLTEVFRVNGFDFEEEESEK